MTWKIFADTGGTFTDCLGQDKAGNWHTCKVLSDGTLRGQVKRIDDAKRKVWIGFKQSFAPNFFAGYSVRWQGVQGESFALNVDSSAGDWLRAGRGYPLPKIGDILQVSAGEEAPVLGARVMTQTLLSESLQISIFNLATTRGTNALLEEKGARVLLFVAEGFEDLLVIDDQRRSDIFALRHSKNPILTRNVVGLPLRRRVDGAVEKTCSDVELEKRVREAV
ncbi:MAG: hydantoinase/oxoprolinase N-terminal domain-containing protein, partial [Verrucomicrobiota bacterium]